MPRPAPTLGAPQGKASCKKANGEWRMANGKRNPPYPTRHSPFATPHLSFAGLVAVARCPNPIPSRTRSLTASAPMVLCLKARESRSPPGQPRTDTQIPSPQPPTAAGAHKHRRPFGVRCRQPAQYPHAMALRRAAAADLRCLARTRFKPWNPLGGRAFCRQTNSEGGVKT